MKITLLHPRHARFPKTDFDWAENSIFPIGVLGSVGDTDVVVGIVQEKRNRKLVAVRVDGSVEDLDASEAGPALYEALDQVGNQLWGNSWNSAVGEIFGLNRRTTQRDRVSTNLLPPRLVMCITYIASAPDAFEMAGLLVVIARYAGALEIGRDQVESYVRAALDFYYGERQDATLGMAY